jgi:hypothetical protein
VLGVSVQPGHAEFVQHEHLGVGAFIMPDGKSPGSLETLCLRPKAVREHPAGECAEAFIRCLVTKGIENPEHPKREFQAFLAGQKEPGLLMGYAAEAGCFDFTDDCWSPLKDFLLALAAE